MARISTLMVMMSFGLAAGCGNAGPGDTTLRYAQTEDPKQSLLVEAAANGDMRIEDGDGRAVFVRDGVAYVVVTTPSGGSAVANVDDYMAVGAEVRARMIAAGVMTGDRDDTRYEARVEGARKIGEWHGDVVAISPVDAAGVTQTIVMSPDPALADVRGVAVKALETFERPSRAVLVYPEQFVQLTTATLARGMPISFDRMDLKEIGRQPIAADRFDLPQKPVSRAELREVMANN